MKIALVVILLSLSIAFSACKTTNNVSKIPQIALIAVVPADSMRVNVDSCYMVFSLVDGDGDIGYSNPSATDTISGVYLKDSRFDSAGFVFNPFPSIDLSIEDPKKGIQGTCEFAPFPQPAPRLDTNHYNHGDTLFYELYIKDRAGHESNHIVTHSIIVRR